MHQAAWLARGRLGLPARPFPIAALLASRTAPTSRGVPSRRWVPGVADLTARAAAGLGALAWEIADEHWTDPANGDEFSDLARRIVRDVRAATALCCSTG